MNNVELLRKTLGWTQQKLADNIGVINRTVSQWETGATVVNRAKDIIALQNLSDSYDLGINFINPGKKRKQKINPNREFADFVRYVRGKAGLSQKQLAEALGQKNRSTILNWESGRYNYRSPHSSTIIPFFRYCNENDIEIPFGKYLNERTKE